MKSENKITFANYTVFDDFSVGSRDSVDTGRDSIPSEFETKWIDAEWNDNYPFASSIVLAWAYGMQVLQHHTFMKDDWTAHPASDTRPPNLNYAMLTEMELPKTTYQVMHYLLSIGDKLEKITLHQERFVDMSSMCCGIYKYDPLDTKHRHAQQQWGQLLRTFRNDLTFFNDHTFDWKTCKPDHYFNTIFPHNTIVTFERT